MCLAKHYVYCVKLFTWSAPRVLKPIVQATLESSVRRTVFNKVKLVVF